MNLAHSCDSVILCSSSALVMIELEGIGEDYIQLYHNQAVLSSYPAMYPVRCF